MGCAASSENWYMPPPRDKPYDPENESDTDFSDEDEYEKIESSLPKERPGHPWTQEQMEERRKVWWGLGREKWKENIDSVRWQHGRFVFDLCLHGQNNHKKEVGYLSSMYDSWCVGDDELGQRFSADSWLAMHKAAMGHPGNDFLNGTFRHLLQGNRALVPLLFNGFPNGLTKEAQKEFNQMPRRLAYVKDLGKERSMQYKWERSMPANKRLRFRHYFQWFLNEMYIELDKPDVYGDVDKVLHPLAKLMQQISRMEPSRDGNTRTLVVAINKIATDYGLHPMLFEWPDAASCVTHVEWIDTMKQGLEQWKKIRDALSEEEKGGERPPREYFVPEDVDPYLLKIQKNAYFSN